MLAARPLGRPLCAALLAAVLPAAGLAATAQGQLYCGRTLMRAAGARCGLFTPEISAGLAASAQQARGAALRSGADRAALAAVEKRARDTAAATRCKSPDLAV